MDRRISQTNQISQATQISCVHTKNIFSLVDLAHHDDSYQRIRKHVDGCQVCDIHYKKFELENLAVKIHIPKPQIDSETKEVFAREISELFKTFDLNEKTLLRKKIKSNIKKIDSLGVGLVKNLFSKTMLASYAGGVVLFVVLKQFFN
jgi:hypothetical protein